MDALAKHKPQTIAQASLIQGMTPAALSLLIFRGREILDKKNRTHRGNESSEA